MNNQVSENESERNEEKLVSRWLAPLDQDAAPPRQDVIDRARQLGGDVFRGADNSQPPVVIESGANQRRRKMLTKAMVGLSAIACTIAMVFSLIGPAIGKPTLGSILDNATQSKSLQLKIFKDGATAAILVQGQSRVRWEESPTKYRIADGSQLWRVDEQANSVASDRSPWFDESKQQIDLLGMMGIGREQAALFRRSLADGTVDHAGTKCQVYRMLDADGQPPIFIEALAEIDTGELRSIVAWTDAKRVGPPLAELTLVARNVPIDESKFVFAKSLSEDGRIGKVVDAQGIVSLRPMMSRRWTPVARQMLLQPGDWLRTDVRGANASALAMTSQFKVVAGPGSLVELQSPHRLRLHGGELQIVGGQTAEGVVEVLGPDDDKVSVAAGKSAIYRIDRQGKIVEIAKKPLWLAGFEGSSNNESIGSLVANIDGRNVPLSIGFHRVKVEIRDQIARTTIEESFVNRTDRTLEGVFHFPLPQDASISGFGMWINDELIEADVVEKQRAREIYETILREKRDPGLLEWTGGNIFKARVFPITPSSEKRIRIVYTQVLPLRANRYRYCYGLRSELLQKTPMRELSLDVQVSSALSLKSVTCPTHAVRSQLTEHAAKLEFTAQEYTPRRDFEVVCEVNSRQSDVVVIPHRRGQDGYFLVQLTPPGAEGNWQREVLPDGQPLELLLVCDTSASMDSEKRRQQEQFVASLLSSLGPKDRFNLAVCDVNCHWMHEQQVEPTREAAEDARQWLVDRISLGWTDLDRMTESVLKRLGKQTHVIYIGDGIVTAGDADPQTFVNRLKRLTSSQRSGAFHAISVGNSFESTVLKALARVGGGSLRQIGGEQTPRKVAFELLNEIAQPGLRDIKVEFRGLQVAAVYPGQPPNLPAGAQQILIGRYLPQGQNQTGEIVISGQRNGQTVRFAARISLADAETGNSFIPRLWARAHLDHLLEQGSSSFIKDEIIAMSEEFHIITPYTSLLVLESDEDRERFGVQRRYQMRDGERFFAEGGDKSTFELLQQQMKRAGDWRLGLRRRILLGLTRLGRNPQLFQQIEQNIWRWSGMPASGPVSSLSPITESESLHGAYAAFSPETAFSPDRAQIFAGSRLDFSFADRESFDGEESGDFRSEAKSGLERDAHWETQDLATADYRLLEKRLEKYEAVNELAGEIDEDRQLAHDQLSLGYQFGVAGRTSRSRGLLDEANRRVSLWNGASRQLGLASSSREPSHYIQWANTLFPALPPAPGKAAPPESKWPEEALAISNNLLQPIKLSEGGVEVGRRTQSTDPQWNRVTGVQDRLELYSPQRWLSLSQSVPSQTLVQWSTGAERGVYSRAFQLGRVRKSHPRDLETFVPGQRAYAESPLHTAYRDYQVAIQRPAADRLVLTLTHATAKHTQARVTIDATKNVVLQLEWLEDGKITSTTSYSDYVQVAGVWWPQKIESFDQQRRSTSLTSQTVKTLAEAAFAKRFEEESPDRDRVKLLSMPLPTLRAAETAAAAGSAGFEHRLVLLLRACLVQKWDEALTQLESLEKLEPGKAGLAWIRPAVLIAARKNEDARQLLQQQADRIVPGGMADEFFLSVYLLDQAGQIVDQNELLRLLARLQPVFERQPEHAAGKHNWIYRRTQCLRRLGRTDEVLGLQRQLASSSPWDLSAQTVYARDLAASGDYAAACAWLRQELDRKVDRHEYQTDQLRGAYADLLREQGRDQDYLAFLQEWIAENPTGDPPYLRYLSALMLAGRTKDADTTAGKWLEAGRVPGKLELADLARLNAAVSYARGQRYQVYMNWMDPIWFKPLQETARFFLDHEQHFHIAAGIINYHHFINSDESDQLRAEIAGRLKTSAETLAENHVAAYVGWVLGRPDLTPADWKQIADTLRMRWREQEDPQRRASLGGAILQIYSVQFRETEQLPFMRARIARAAQAEDPTLAATLRYGLFNELLSRPWRDEYEAEALELLPHLSAAEQVSQRLATQINGLHRFVDRMLAARYQADMKKLQDQGHPEELTRTELFARQAAFRKAAQEGLSGRLQVGLTRQADAPAPSADEAAAFKELNQWIELERMYLDVKLERHLKQVAERCWDTLGDAPRQGEADEETPKGPRAADQRAESLRRGAIEELRRERAFAMVSYLAVRRSAPKALVERVLNYVAAGVSLPDERSAQWKNSRFALLVALDRPEQLERELREWIRGDAYPAPWQLALGRLLAEQGKIEDAIGLFETVERGSQLSSADYAALGDWYLVADQRDRHRRAKVEVFKASQEHQISNWIRRKREPWRRSDRPLPTELDENVLFAFQALFEKSNQPQNYVYELKEFYLACRDFRLLQMLPDALTGRTPQQVYPFLQNLKSNLLYEIRKEATADEILKRLAEVRASCESAIDLRALDLLESMIERQSAEVLNQPAPHIEAAVAALRRAFRRDWAEGEVRQMAELLDSLGTIKQTKLNEERLRQLRALLEMTQAGSDDRLFVSWHLAHALFWSHGLRDEGIARMEIALGEFERSHPDGWPAYSNTPLSGYADLLEAEKRFADAEQLLTKQLDNPLNEAQENWLRQRRNQSYLDALRNDGRVSLGSGAELYRNLEGHLIEQLDAIDNDNHRRRTVSQLLKAYEIAKDKAIQAYKADLRKFAFQRLPAILKRQTNDYHNLVGETADTMHRLLGPRDALEFAIDRYEAYPPRFQYTWQNAWRQLSYRLANWHEELKRKVGDLEPRLLAIVLEELRRDLVMRNANSQYFYHRRHHHFWNEKADEFARVAEEVLKERSESGRSVAYIARYLYRGLARHQRAIEILLIAHDKKLLKASQQIELCDFLHEQQRHAESIPILEPLVEISPDAMAYRTRLLTAYHRSSRPEQMRRLLAETDAHFRQGGRWVESNIALLAENCLNNDLFTEAAQYYGELIPLHQRTAANRGIGNHTLSNYYSNQGRAYSGLGQTRQAVEAAAGAVIAWGPRYDQRAAALNWLERILSAAKDLDDYVKHLDTEAKRAGQDSPLIRKYLGIVYARRDQHQKAISQLRVAIELQPTDVESHQKLIESYKALRDQAGVIQQTLALLEIDRHNLKLYKELADELQSDEALAERAATTVVEAAPGEAEHHQALAEIRQGQDRWSEAINQWKRVARLRSLEPEGLLKLAEAQIHEKRFSAAQVSLDQLIRTDWPSRFSDVRSRVQNLQQRIPRKD